MRIALIGTGNLAIHLLKAFEKCPQISCVQWIGRKAEPPITSNKTPYFVEYQHDIQNDICLIAVSDDAIQPIAQQLKDNDTLVAHTAGAVSLGTLAPLPRKGVFYPLQSFMQHLTVEWSSIPICVEAENQEDTLLLKSLAHLLSKEVHEISEQQRLNLHTAAVFANNFCNHLLNTSQQITTKAEVPFSLLHPLISETFKRTFVQKASQIQTGPAIRNDLETQKKHLALLSDKEAELYRSLSQSIFNTHNS